MGQARRAMPAGEVAGPLPPIVAQRRGAAGPGARIVMLATQTDRQSAVIAANIARAANAITAGFDPGPMPSLNGMLFYRGSLFAIQRR